MVGFQKRYDPEKCYVYIVSVKREKQSDSIYLFRTYREFCELHQKLLQNFPLVSNQLESLSKGVYLGRSSVKAVAEKRLSELDQFLVSLFRLAEEISHSDLVYTFLHPLLRDQDEEANFNTRKLKNKPSRHQLRNQMNSNQVQGNYTLSSFIVNLYSSMMLLVACGT